MTAEVDDGEREGVSLSAMLHVRPLLDGGRCFFYMPTSSTLQNTFWISIGWKAEDDGIDGGVHLNT